MKIKELLRLLRWVIVGYLVIQGILFALSGCRPKDSVGIDDPYNAPNRVFRYVDDEAGVVCFVYREGINCLPRDQTRLGQ